MNYPLILSILINIILLVKIIAMRVSLKEIRQDFAANASLAGNTPIGISSRDKELRLLTSALNDTLATLRDSYHKYRQGDAAVKTAITNIAHDLRTPLTAICGYLELSMAKDMSDDLRKYLAIINERSLYMKGLTEELFEYSVITGGEVSEEKKKLNLGQILEDCIMNYYPALTERGIKPVVEITEERVERELYPSYTERIFNNLIGNALKYSDGDLEISLSQSGRFTIANTASSLSNVDVNKLFDRFFTVENARNDSKGLGLSIVKTFAERMDCSIGASYEGGKLIIEIRF